MWSLGRTGRKKGRQNTVKRGAKEAQSLIRRRRWSIFMRSVSLMIVCIGVIGSVYIWKSGLLQEWTAEISHSLDREVSDAGYMVSEVRITGQQKTSLQQVRSALAIYDGQSIVSLKLDRMLERVEALSWVKSATIKRIMPDIVDVTIQEYKVAAVWQRNNLLFLVTEAGHVITDQDIDGFQKHLHVVGPGANENLPGLFALRDQYPKLFAGVKSAIWVGDRRWDLNFHNGVKIKLPEKAVGHAWERLNQYESKQKILSKEILVIDLRLEGKTILRLTPEEARKQRTLKKTGIMAGKKENI